MAAPSLYGFALGPSSVYGVTECVKRVTTRVCGKYLLHVTVVCYRPVFPPAPAPCWVLRALPMPAFTDLRARTNAGEDVSFDVFTGKVVLVVNVARL